MSEENKEKVFDVIDAVKFLPGRPGRILIRLLRHPEPLIILYTEEDKLNYGEVNITFEGEKFNNHYKLVEKLLYVPIGKSVCVEFYPRADLQRAGTEAHFAFCEIEPIIPLAEAPVQLG